MVIIQVVSARLRRRSAVKTKARGRRFTPLEVGTKVSAKVVKVSVQVVMDVSQS